MHHPQSLPSWVGSGRDLARPQDPLAKRARPLRRRGRWRHGKAPRPDPPAAEPLPSSVSSAHKKRDLPPRMRSPEGDALWLQFPVERAVEDSREPGLEAGRDLRPQPSPAGQVAANQDGCLKITPSGLRCPLRQVSCAAWLPAAPRASRSGRGRLPPQGSRQAQRGAEPACRPSSPCRERRPGHCEEPRGPPRQTGSPRGSA